MPHVIRKKQPGSEGQKRRLAEAFVKDLMVSPREDQAADHPINYLRPAGQEAANRGNGVPRDREVSLGEVSPGSDLCCRPLTVSRRILLLSIADDAQK